MSIEDDLPKLVDLVTERYGKSAERIAGNLADLIDAGNRLANVLDNVPKKTRNTGTVRKALERWDAARDEFPEIDP